MFATKLSEGIAHKMPDDLKKALLSDKKLVEKWEGLTPLARNEWICWNVTVKQEATRQEHIKRTKTELLEGKRRPCCWIGCIHRTDKPMNKTQVWMQGKSKK